MADGENGGPLVPAPSGDVVPADKTRDKLIRAIVEFMLKRYGPQIADAVKETLKRIPTSKLRELLKATRKTQQAKLPTKKTPAALPAGKSGGGAALLLLAFLVLRGKR